MSPLLARYLVFSISSQTCCVWFCAGSTVGVTGKRFTLCYVYFNDLFLVVHSECKCLQWLMRIYNIVQVVSIIFRCDMSQLLISYAFLNSIGCFLCIFFLNFLGPNLTVSILQCLMCVCHINEKTTYLFNLVFFAPNLWAANVTAG